MVLTLAGTEADWGRARAGLYTPLLSGSDDFAVGTSKASSNIGESIKMEESIC